MRWFYFHNLKVINFLLFDTRIRLKYTSKKNSVNETLSTKQTVYHVNFGVISIIPRIKNIRKPWDSIQKQT